MLYIGPWLEYELAKLLEEQRTTGRNSKPPTPQPNAYSSNSSSRLTGASLSAGHSITRERAGRNDRVNSGQNSHVPVISQQHHRYTYGETRSLRRFQSELSSFGTRNNGHRERHGRSLNRFKNARAVEKPEPTDKHVSRVRRMQQIYRQGKAIAEREKVARGLAGHRKQYQPISATPQHHNSAINQDKASDDDLISWAGALDVETI